MQEVYFNMYNSLKRKELKLRPRYQDAQSKQLSLARIGITLERKLVKRLVGLINPLHGSLISNIWGLARSQER